MNSHPTCSARGPLLLAVFATLWGISACHPEPPEQPRVAQPPDPMAASDAKAIDRMEMARARAQQAPGGSAEASDFAFQLTLLHTQGIAKRRNLPASLLDEASACVDQAREAKPDDAPDLLTRKGEMLIAAGRTEAGVGSLRESISIRPNLRAFTPLAKHFVVHDQTAVLESLCKRTLPAMKSDDSRYAVLDECLKGSGSTVPEVGLRWAAVKDVSFYKARKRELEERLAATKKSRPKDGPDEVNKK